ncbi:unnamed protein product [Acanthoscelides obtectus]|uniref:Uncharacterized protein n=1 Tax=Acanthoscelides obtectus TaxID=200917 RepID=A0A9P0LAU9_ACAOB|nr:unnamed protein product [Acanthoscelides obtectus]CAK1629620.1 hypothetical protein AOBTE_LOCUS5853 [Acanthoscelides obtectus]
MLGAIARSTTVCKTTAYVPSATAPRNALATRRCAAPANSQVANTSATDWATAPRISSRTSATRHTSSYLPCAPCGTNGNGGNSNGGGGYSPTCCPPPGCGPCPPCGPCGPCMPPCCPPPCVPLIAQAPCPPPIIPGPPPCVPIGRVVPVAPAVPCPIIGPPPLACAPPTGGIQCCPPQCCPCPC